MALTIGAKQTYTTPGGGQQALYNQSCMLDSTHFVVTWRDPNDSDQGKSVIGTVSGSTVTYGSVVTFNAADTRNPSVCKIDSTHFAVAFRDSGDSGKGKAMIATVASGDVITYGAEYTFAAGTCNNPDIALLDSTHLVVSYDDVTNTDGSAIVGTISATDVITFGTRVAFKSSSINGSIIAVLDSTHFVVVFNIAAVSAASIVGVVSGGTTITFGSEVSLLATSVGYVGVSTIDSTHFLVGYRDDTAGLAAGNVGTVASGDVITLGTKYSAAITLDEIIVGQMSSTTFFFAGTNGGALKVITGTISGSVLSYDTAVTADSGSNGYVGGDMLTSSSLVVTYSNTDSTPIGTAKICYFLAYTMAAATGAFTLTGISNVMRKGRTLTASAGSFALTGVAATFRRTIIMSAATGAFTLTGVSNLLKYARIMSAGVGSFILTGMSILFGARYTYDTKPTNSYSNDTKPTSSYSNDAKPTSSYSNDNKPTTSYSNDTKPSGSWTNDDEI